MSTTTALERCPGEQSPGHVDQTQPLRTFLLCRLTSGGPEEATIAPRVQVRTLEYCSAPGTTTPGLNVRAVSDSVQEKVPGAIIVEGKACTPKGALHVNVFVLAPDKKPLMPATPRRARMWLKQKRARIVNRTPFTIQLRFEAGSRYTQLVKVGVDTGSKTVGVAAVANSQVLYQAEFSLRTGIERSLNKRRQYRNGSRSKHKVSAPKKVFGWKLFELIEVNGQVGYVSGRGVNGRFSVKDAVTGRLLADGISQLKLIRLSRSAHGLIVHVNVVQ